ncbi:phosphoglycerate dehydrogenase [Spiribacter salinus]|jgi:D-3-phosphoglycerate dehydrogenase|nr:phosphoglycerate dehydrogenase [Spiribacter salinus]MBY5267993.1 3-phosphoglycerate dehydrogenase [Spiribacter salinus]MDR9413662.1 phosphoglycerate dehydrogenase [Spiribacter sp.]MDR9454111.1 phosphoglycerate dehydrogenase [Spiribacter sp.]TQE98958.1 MAG: 3-phosphoglycerate dehydrogenase [Spiribacter salinus]
MHKILTMNNISARGLDRFPREQFEIASEMSNPDAVLLRSAKLHDWDIPDTLKAVGRAGAGVNNIPVDAMSKRGIPVFNAPGANANAVKELVLGGLFMAARCMGPAWEFSRGLTGTNAEMNQAAEAGKKQFTGFELPGRTLGVIGLGAIGVNVANAAMALGMRVIGYDPQITVRSAWNLEAGVRRAHSVDEVLAAADVVTLHVPETDDTRGLINGARLAGSREGQVLLNFARAGIVDETAVVKALDQGRLRTYVCDFPAAAFEGRTDVIALPHIGASTNEAQENCAVMAADEVRDYLETGNIVNAVNFPELMLPRNGSGDRLTVANANVPNMLGQISSAVAEADLNIADMYNKSRGDLAYSVVDIDGKLPDDVVTRLRSTEGVLAVRVIE